MKRARGAKRVLVLSHLPPPYGGLTVHTQRLRAALVHSGWTVEVLEPPTASHARGTRFRRLRSVWRQVRFFVRLLSAPCAVVHDHLSTYSIGWMGGRTALLQIAMLGALRLKRTPWVLSSGNGLLPGIVSAVPPHVRAIHRWFYRGVAVGIAKSEPILDVFRQLGFGDRSRVVGTFLAPAGAYGIAPLAPEIEGFLKEHTECVVAAGFQFQPLYHLDAVVRAAADARAPELGRSGHQGLGVILLGSQLEDAAGKSLLDAAIADAGMAPHVLILRDVDYALDVIARAAVFVRPTDVDGDANTVKEAMLVGVPVLATDLPGRPPGLSLVPREALSELGARLRDLLDHPDRAAVERNQAWVRADIARNTAAILDAYREACGG